MLDSPIAGVYAGISGETAVSLWIPGGVNVSVFIGISGDTKYLCSYPFRGGVSQ
jgi:hypothetical protein